MSPLGGRLAIVIIPISPEAPYFCPMSADPAKRPAPNFIRSRIEADRAGGRCQEVVTRFPPEPNGHLHIGHAKALCLNFDLAQEYGGRCRLRFDDTNPETEMPEFEEAIRRDIRWLGYRWEEPERAASDYFKDLYEFARELIRRDCAYVCSLDAEAIRSGRGTLTEPGTPSPYRARSAKESLRLFAEMREGLHLDGAHVLRARIDMASPNMNLRDPVLYRIRHAAHHRTNRSWCIYPMYDFAHCLSDVLEGVSHSLCTLEFEDHRPLYEWFLDVLEVTKRPQQIEFARLNLSCTVTSKRRLKQLVEEGHVASWDDPRMPTLSGLRRRGCPPAAIRDFCRRIGVAKADSLVELAQLEHSIRDELERCAPRAMCVLHPLRVELIDWPSGRQDILRLPGHPGEPSFGEREVPFSGALYIEAGDYTDEPPPKYKRLAPGCAVRLRGGCIIRCQEVERDAAGQPVLLRCSWDDATFGRKPDYPVGGVLHWVPAQSALSVEVRLYEPLFDVPEPAASTGNLGDFLRPDSRQRLPGSKAEPSLASAEPGNCFQFERLGYFCVDADSRPEQLVFNRTVALRDSWGRRRRQS